MAFVLAWAMAAAAAQATVYLPPVTWSASGDTRGWFNTNGVAASVTATNSLSNPGGYLSMTFNPVEPSQEQIDCLVTTNAWDTGDYPADQIVGVRFDFLGYPTGGLQYVYFEGAGSRWEHLLDVTARTWQTFDVRFVESAWTPVSGSSAFSASLAQVALIGFQTVYTDDGVPFEFGLDNWELYVPEPATWAFAVTLLLSAALQHRRLLARIWKAWLLRRLANPEP